MRMFRRKPELYVTFSTIFIASIVSLVVCLIVYNIRRNRRKNAGYDPRGQDE